MVTDTRAQINKKQKDNVREKKVIPIVDIEKIIIERVEYRKNYRKNK